MNLDVPALSAKDTFRWNPWRVSTRNTRRSPPPHSPILIPAAGGWGPVGARAGDTAPLPCVQP